MAKRARNPAVVAGDISTVAQLLPTTMRSPEKWTQEDSDIIAHLFHVQSQIGSSRWSSAPVNFTIQGETTLEHAFPEFEDFVYALIYLRQLFAKKDALLKDATNRYFQFGGSPSVAAWVHYELKAFDSALAGKAFMLPEFTVKELLDAFMYGAGIFHKFRSKAKEENCRKFLELMDNQRRTHVLYSVNMSMHGLMNHARKIGIVLFHEFTRWLEEHSLPQPDARWHGSIFKIYPPSSTQP